MTAPADDRIPPPPPWLAWSILGVGAVVVLVGLLLVVLRLTDDGDDPSELAATDTTTSTTAASTTTTTAAPATSTTTTVAPTTAPTRRPTTTSVRPSPTTTARPAPTTTAAPATTAAPSGPVFTARSVNWYGTSDGTFAGDAQVTNNSSSTRTGTFTVRLFRYGEVVGTLRGSRTIPAGATVEVSLSSNDQFVTGVDDYEFSASG